MALQWSTATTPNYGSDTLRPVKVAATRQLPGSNYLYANFEITFSVSDEYPSLPTEGDVLGWLGTIFEALDGDGWTPIHITQSAASSREIEDV